ncbi:hypothetical protein GBO31_06905 [Aquimarina litoralis]|nr:hypothetical protein [Aquimarina litoralis]
MEALNIKFDIDLLHAASEYFEHEVHQFRSEILYPIKLAGRSIFKDKNLITGLYLMFGKLFLQLHYADGLLTRDIKKIL